MFVIPEAYALYINIGIFVFYLLFFLVGWKRGVLYQVITTFGTVVSLFIAYRYCTLMSQYVHLWPRALAPFQDTVLADKIYTYMNEVFCFIALFLGARLVFHLLEKLAEGLQEVPLFKQIGSLLGGIFGMSTATVWIFVFCFIMNTGLVKNSASIQQKTMFSTIREAVSYIAESAGLSMDGSQILDTVYEQISTIDNKDIEAIRNWLDERGYEPLEDSAR